MDATGASTAIMIAVAAALWFLYFVPSWFRRREYLATERNATRLQQTLRIMAETAELPDTVRTATTAREIARHERMLKQQQRRADGLAARAAMLAQAALPPAAGLLDTAALPAPRLQRQLTGARLGPASISATIATTRRRMRRTRRIAAGLLVASTVVLVVQFWLMAATGVVVGSWLVLFGALGVGVLAVGVQRRLDVRAMPRHFTAPARRPVTVTDWDARPAAPTAWTPVPVPKPLYLSQPAPQSIAPSIDAERVLREAAAEAERAQRAIRDVAPIRPVARPAASSRFARMGIVDPAAASAPDLDEVLRRRRSVG